jgi:hypothetical protein
MQIKALINGKSFSNMQLLFILVICIIAISVGIIAMVRTHLKSKSKELAEKLNHISSYSEKSNYEQARERLNNLRNEVTACVEGWSILRVGSMAKNIEEYAINFQDVLTELSSMTNLPIIEYDRTQRKYSIVVADQSAEFKVEGGIESLQFKQAITQADGFSIVAIVVAILIHTLILFNYIMAYRTRTIRVGKDTEEDGGRILY